MRLACIFAALAASTSANGTCCPNGYWRQDQCVFCPSYWWGSCPNGYDISNERGCGFWNMGCSPYCNNNCASRDEGCGCGNGKGCLKKDCVLSAWGSWSTCTATCGGGTQTKSRTIDQDVAHGGRACEALSATRDCGTDPCPCEVGAWGAYGECSTTCGPGKKTRFRDVTRDPDAGAAACPTLSQEADCNLTGCPVNCEVSQWSGYEDCNVTCGGGLKIRTRTITQNPANGGTACPHLEDAAMCNTDYCPVPCEYTWKEDNDCSVSCGDGSKVREVIVIRDAEHNGAACPSPITEVCNEGACPPENCVLSEWAPFGECSQTCGAGTISWTRFVVTDAKHGGTCEGDLVEVRPCQVVECPVPCVLTDGPWSDCSVTCGDGTKTRWQEVAEPAQHGGECDPQPEETTCNEGDCPEDCVLGNGEWSECSVTCGGDGSQSMTQIVVQDAVNGGSCNPETETRTCNEGDCPFDCNSIPFYAGYYIKFNSYEGRHNFKYNKLDLNDADLVETTRCLCAEFCLSRDEGVDIWTFIASPNQKARCSCYVGSDMMRKKTLESGQAGGVGAFQQAAELEAIILAD